MNDKRIQQDEQRKQYEMMLREYEETQQGERPEEPYFEEIQPSRKN